MYYDKVSPFPFLDPGFVAVSVLVDHHSRGGVTQKYATCFVTLSNLFSRVASLSRGINSLLPDPTQGR